MIQYPSSFAPISDEEMEYTVGGTSSAGAACAVSGFVISMVAALDVLAIKKDLRQQNPDRDNLLLTVDAYNSYMEKPYGMLMMVSGMFLTVAGLIL